MKAKSIAEKIAELSNPGLSAFHPDIEDTVNETAARFEEFTEDASLTSAKKDLKQRRIPASFAFDDEKYSGKRVSRKELNSGSESESGIDEDTLSAFQSKLQAHSSSDEEDISDVENVVEGSEEEDVNEDEEVSDAVNEEEELSGEEEEDAENGVESGLESDADADNFKAVASTKGVSEVEKGRALQAQFSICDQLIESRIKLQKALLASNKLPQASSWTTFVTPLENDGRTALKSAQNSLKDLLDSLLELQGQLFMSNSKTRSIVAKGGNSKPPKLEGSDEEIPSDTEDEEEPSEEPGYEPLSKRLKLQQYSHTIKERHTKFVGYRNEMIQYWNQRTKLASGKLSSKSFQKFEQSTLKQIELILADRDRLVKRTQIKRSAYLPLGAAEKSSEEEKKADGDSSDKAEDAFEYDGEIFDDDDFYHQLLREFVERKTSDSSDAAALGRQLLEIQKLRSKGKRKVDTKASKGRRIRYDVHQKLVNFMPPINKGMMSEEVTNDLFDSLFGKRLKAS